MTAPARHWPNLSKTALGLLGIGILFIVAYFVLDLFDVGKIGAPTDIGGGLILLAGYVLIAIALVMGVIELVHRKRHC